MTDRPVHTSPNPLLAKQLVYSLHRLKTEAVEELLEAGFELGELEWLEAPGLSALVCRGLPVYRFWIKHEGSTLKVVRESVVDSSKNCLHGTPAFGVLLDEPVEVVLRHLWGGGTITALVDRAGRIIEPDNLVEEDWVISSVKKPVS